LHILNQNLKLIHSPEEKSQADQQDIALESSNLILSLDRLNQNQESALITVTQSGHSGRIYVNRGEIVRANFRALEGIAALKKMAGLLEADTTIHVTEVQETSDHRVDTNTILSQLKTFFSAQHQLLQECGSPQERLWLQDPESLEIFSSTDINRQILELCRKGETLHQLLMIMNQDNLEILVHVKELIQKQMLAAESLQELPEREPPKKSTFSRILRRMRKIFKKSHQRKSREEEALLVKSEQQSPPEHQKKLPELHTGVSELDSGTREKIRLYFKGKSL